MYSFWYVKWYLYICVRLICLKIKLRLSLIKLWWSDIYNCTCHICIKCPISETAGCRFDFAHAKATEWSSMIFVFLGYKSLNPSRSLRNVTCGSSHGSQIEGKVPWPFRTSVIFFSILVRKAYVWSIRLNVVIKHPNANKKLMRFLLYLFLINHILLRMQGKAAIFDNVVCF